MTGFAEAACPGAISTSNARYSRGKSTAGTPNSDFLTSWLRRPRQSVKSLWNTALFGLSRPDYLRSSCSDLLFCCDSKCGIQAMPPPVQFASKKPVLIENSCFPVSISVQITGRAPKWSSQRPTSAWSTRSAEPRNPRNRHHPKLPEGRKSEITLGRLHPRTRCRRSPHTAPPRLNR